MAAEPLEPGGLADPPRTYGPPPRKLFGEMGGGVWVICALCLGACVITGLVGLDRWGKSRTARDLGKTEDSAITTLQTLVAAQQAFTATGTAGAPAPQFVGPGTPIPPGGNYFWVDDQGVIRFAPPKPAPRASGGE